MPINPVGSTAKASYQPTENLRKNTSKWNILPKIAKLLKNTFGRAVKHLNSKRRKNSNKFNPSQVTPIHTHPIYSNVPSPSTQINNNPKHSELQEPMQPTILKSVIPEESMHSSTQDTLPPTSTSDDTITELSQPPLEQFLPDTSQQANQAELLNIQNQDTLSPTSDSTIRESSQPPLEQPLPDTSQQDDQAELLNIQTQDTLSPTLNRTEPSQLPLEQPLLATSLKAEQSNVVEQTISYPEITLTTSNNTSSLNTELNSMTPVQSQPKQDDILSLPFSQLTNENFFKTLHPTQTSDDFLSLPFAQLTNDQLLQTFHPTQAPEMLSNNTVITVNDSEHTDSSIDPLQDEGFFEPLEIDEKTDKPLEFSTETPSKSTEVQHTPSSESTEEVRGDMDDDEGFVDSTKRSAQNDKSLESLTDTPSKSPEVQHLQSSGSMEDTNDNEDDAFVMASDEVVMPSNEVVMPSDVPDDDDDNDDDFFDAFTNVSNTDPIPSNQNQVTVQSSAQFIRDQLDNLNNYCTKFRELLTTLDTTNKQENHYKTIDLRVDELKGISDSFDQFDLNHSNIIQAHQGHLQQIKNTFMQINLDLHKIQSNYVKEDNAFKIDLIENLIQAINQEVSQQQ